MDDIHKLPDKVEIREDTPEDIKVAIQAFFEATKMIKEGYVEKMPGEYDHMLGRNFTERVSKFKLKRAMEKRDKMLKKIKNGKKS